MEAGLGCGKFELHEYQSFLFLQCGDKFASDLASKVNSIPSGSASISASASGSTGTASFASKFAENNPKIANEIKKRVEEVSYVRWSSIKCLIFRAK